MKTLIDSKILDTDLKEPLDPIEFLSRQLFFLRLPPDMQEMITPEDLMLPQAEFEAKLLELDEVMRLKKLNQLT